MGLERRDVSSNRGGRGSVGVEGDWSANGVVPEVHGYLAHDLWKLRDSESEEIPSVENVNIDCV
jgi:hypothetical protein